MVPAAGATEVVRRVEQTRYEQPYDPPRRRSGWLAAAIVLLLLALAGLAYLLARSFGLGDTGVTQIDVPRVVGLPLEEARRELLDQGFLIGDTAPEANDDFDENIVFDQDPEEGSRADRGSEVDLRVSSGRATVAVPDVEGQSEEDARTALDGAGFEVDARQESSENVESGNVISQDPVANTQLRPPGPVTIVVSSGQPAEDVPDVVGRTAEEAAGILGRAGFEPRNGGSEPSDEPEGTVIRTDPPAGTSLTRGSTVFYAVSSGPPETTTTTEPPDETTTTEDPGN
ncbi:MAG: PASTA domain-containing protein [Acidimicrobiia bacterium]|nr:PASTA domain-containing protein [Acidimicrobiia bacterium]